MLIGGVVGWLLAPEARTLLVHGQPLAALGTHMAGWIGAIAVWRGDAHRSVDDDDEMAGRLLRWAVPGLAIPWLLGHQLTSGAAEIAFTSAAFMGTIVFTGSAFTAMGLARLEAVRQATGSDWRANRSWLLLVLGVALSLTVIGIPAAALLGVPASALLTALIGPLRVTFLVLLLITTPLIVLIAALTEFVGSLLPHGFQLPNIQLPSFFAVDPGDVISDAPTVIVFSGVIILVIVELAILALIIYLRWQERRRYRFAPEDPFEEREIAIPPAEVAAVAAKPPRRRPRLDPNDPTGAYLSALDVLERDGRWPRRATETPAAHVDRVAAAGLPGGPLRRLATAYQLVRYGERRLGPREASRSRGRLARLRDILRGIA